ncbi:Nitrogen assimilation regulatory protein [Luteitalea pratensis]|uniref:Nitrogen assimilation regulatory protein n=1 Tax=Luteitalea pratensis TaxID=1855912 RepID=A0A143PEH3_LUTPR|nr:RNA repair transcriptional activator RtcR [Luteitalea pratensis]AMY06972.1 Nitrogen assimilation regulatory protein [Luteitalea pratensis]
MLGLLGSTLDRGTAGPRRWEHWRPSVALCQHEDLVVSRFELLFAEPHASLAATVRDDIRHVSPETEVRLHVDATTDPWDFESVYAHLHDFARAYPFDPEAEDYLVHITTGSHVAQICLFLLTESRHIPGCLVQTSPPRRTRAIEPGGYQVIDLDLSKYDRIATRFAKDELDERTMLTSGIGTRNAAFEGLVTMLDRVATRSAAPMLLLGPTGAGKSRMARRVYDLKKARRLVRGPFVEVNCATIRGDAAMSALFGHVRGAFTGALRDRPGLLRSANEGVLFLDEIAELGLDEQAMLLRALEEKRFLPLGGDREASSDFQLIGGTNRDLSQAVREGRFRDDLLARINLWTFRLPGLVDRREDIAPNLAYELEQFRQRTGTAVTFSTEARRLFLEFAEGPDAPWPGNFRDLNAVVTRLATLAPGGRITVDQVAAEIATLRALWRESWAGHTRDGLIDLVVPAGTAVTLDRFDRAQLEDVLTVCRSAPSLSAAGRVLFDRSRARKQSVNDADRLRKYLARFGLDWHELKASV